MWQINVRLRAFCSLPVGLLRTSCGPSVGLLRTTFRVASLAYRVCVCVWLMSGWDSRFVLKCVFEFALGGAVGFSWEAGLGLEVVPKTIACTQINISPIGCTKPSFVKVVGWAGLEQI